MTDRKGSEHPDIQALVNTIENAWSLSVKGESAPPADVFAAIGAALSGIIRAATSRDSQQARLVMALQALASGFPEICLHCQMKALIEGRLGIREGVTAFVDETNYDAAILDVHLLLSELFAGIVEPAKQKYMLARFLVGFPRSVELARKALADAATGGAQPTKH